MLNKKLYDEWKQESGHSFEKILLSSFDQLFYSKNMHLSSPTNRHQADDQQASSEKQSMDWTDTVYIKGELLFKIIVECIINFHYSVSKDVWNIFFHFLLFFRKRGSLSSDLSLLTNEYSTNGTNDSLPPAVSAMMINLGDDLKRSHENNAFHSLYCYPTSFTENCKIFSFLGLDVFPPIKKSALIQRRLESQTRKFYQYDQHHQNFYFGNNPQLQNPYSHQKYASKGYQNQGNQGNNSWWGNIFGWSNSNDNNEEGRRGRFDLQPFHKYLLFAEEQTLLEKNEKSPDLWLSTVNSFDLMEFKNNISQNSLLSEVSGSGKSINEIFSLIRTDDYLASQLFEHYHLKKHFIELFNLSNLKKSDAFFSGILESLNNALKKHLSSKNKENGIDLLTLFQSSMNSHSFKSGGTTGLNPPGNSSTNINRMNWFLQYERMNSNNDFFQQQEQQQNILLNDLFPLQYLTSNHNFLFSNKTVNQPGSEGQSTKSGRGGGGDTVFENNEFEEYDTVFLLELLCSMIYESDRHWNYFGFKIYRKLFT
jgi:hypothetical protein